MLDLVQEAIARRVLGEFSDTERRAQVDESFKALQDSGIPEKRIVSARMMRDLSPINNIKWRRWSNEEKAVGRDIMAEHTAQSGKISAQGRIVEYASY